MLHLRLLIAAHVNTGRLLNEIRVAFGNQQSIFTSSYYVRSYYSNLSQSNVEFELV